MKRIKKVTSNVDKTKKVIRKSSKGFGGPVVTEHLESRVTALSAQVTNLDEADREIKKHLAVLTDNVTQGFKELTAKIEARSQTPWTTIIALLALILTGMTTVGWIARQPLADGIVGLAELQRKEADMRTSADLRIDQRITSIQRDLDYLRGEFGFYHHLPSDEKTVPLPPPIK